MIYIFLDLSQLFVALAAHWNHLCIFNKFVNTRLLPSIIDLTSRGEGQHLAFLSGFLAVVEDY